MVLFYKQKLMKYLIFIPRLLFQFQSLNVLKTALACVSAGIGSVIITCISMLALKVLNQIIIGSLKKIPYPEEGVYMPPKIWTRVSRKRSSCS